MAPEAEVEVVADAAAVATRGAEIVERALVEAVQARGRAMLALSGGHTPKALYQQLATAPGLSWDRIHLFFGDERHVPPDDEQSNARMAREALVARVPIPPANVHRVRAERPDASEAARDYEHELRRVFAATTPFPSFDLVLLGLGPEGHTASLFPGSPALHERSAWVVAPWVEKFKTYRITLTPPVLNAARSVLFLVAGADKADALQATLAPAGSVDQTPARVVKPQAGRLIFLVDRAAAAKLAR